MSSTTQHNTTHFTKQLPTKPLTDATDTQRQQVLMAIGAAALNAAAEPANITSGSIQPTSQLTNFMMAGAHLQPNTLASASSTRKPSHRISGAEIGYIIGGCIGAVLIIILILVLALRKRK